MNAWYLLHCKGNQEERAQLNIENQGYTTCLPQIKRQKIVQGKRVECIEPLFPNYIFICLDKSTANFNALRSTRGVNELWSNLVYEHQAVFLSDCSITCSPSWNLTLLTTRVSS